MQMHQLKIQQWFRKLIFLLLLCALFLIKNPASANSENFRFAEKANIALRRTAHLLLVKNGDSLSTIPPVKQLDANTFSIRMEHVFDYKQLPELLKQSLQMQQIVRGYNVSMRKCENNELQLGYNFLDLNQEGGVPCGGRIQTAGCYQLQISFLPETVEATTGGNWWALPFGTLLAGLGYIVWKKSRPRNELQTTSETLDFVINESKMLIGMSRFDIANQTLTSAGVTHQLTFREAKLLALFARNANQVLDRDFILKSVWEDEGVIVGRSVDVFVSRLRKILANEPAVKIAAVHGVGYKMEVFS
ncbi:winged helix-turn-helix domain-containing protein [Dyadobacter sp. CY326]|uniref:winged helix-turn-helix domain-containing protein n=1 Tax=Dyadobacter sp. CY326 TaxID=2907300 RepID=UPI001F30CC9A|nr:winged helix-turn-helix domain-containing protein [Dyadobacter sp. CY326]MCE7065676.1 winged helix-turn-helix domain-containing protein [Dyadobacter sp. CY326]